MCDRHSKFEEDRTKTAVAVVDDRYFGQTDIHTLKWFCICPMSSIAWDRQQGVQWLQSPLPTLYETLCVSWRLRSSVWTFDIVWLIELTVSLLRKITYSASLKFVRLLVSYSSAFWDIRCVDLVILTFDPLTVQFPDIFSIDITLALWQTCMTNRSSFMANFVPKPLLQNVRRSSPHYHEV